MTPVIDPKVAPNVQALFPGEKIHFVVKSRRKYPLVYGVLRLVTAFLFLTIVLSFAGGVVNSIFGQGDMFPNWNKYVVFGFFIVFFIIALLVLIDSLRILFWDQVWFVGTDKRIAMLEKEKMHSKPWSHFHDNVLKYGDKGKGSVILMPKAGSSGSSLIMSGITNCDQIQKLCQKRIMEATKLPASPDKTPLKT